MQVQLRKYCVLFLIILFFACNVEKEEKKISMTAKALETPFSLPNGMQIDELRVDSFKNELPFVFYLKETFQLSKFHEEENKTYLQKMIFFDRPNKGYTWRNDSTWGIFDINVVAYKYRGFVSKKNRSDNTYQKEYDIYPIKFKPGAWYLVDFRQDEKHRDFLHVINDSMYKFYKLE